MSSSRAGRLPLHRGQSVRPAPVLRRDCSTSSSERSGISGCKSPCKSSNEMRCPGGSARNRSTMRPRAKRVVRSNRIAFCGDGALACSRRAFSSAAASIGAAAQALAQRAYQAFWCARRANCRTQIHHRRVPIVRRAGHSHAARLLVEFPRRGIGRMFEPVADPMHDAPDVYVEGCIIDVEAKCANCRCSVRPDTGQLTQQMRFRRHHTVEALDNDAAHFRAVAARACYTPIPATRVIRRPSLHAQALGYPQSAQRTLRTWAPPCPPGSAAA